MTKKDLKKVYNSVFENLKTHPDLDIKRKRGLLYKIIQIINGEDEPNSKQEKTEELCDLFGIEKNSYEQDDIKIIKDLVSVVFIDRQALSDFIPGVKDLISNLAVDVNQGLNKLNIKEGKKMEWFIIAACALVGGVACVTYLKRTKQVKENKRKSSNNNKSITLPSQPISAALCFVVPAHIVYGIKEGDSLNRDQVVKIADKASYFNCDSIKKSLLKEEKLLLTDEQIQADSQREVYIKIETDNGTELIDISLAYRLKMNLPTNSGFTVTKLASLKDLSGLDVFTRI